MDLYNNIIVHWIFLSVPLISPNTLLLSLYITHHDVPMAAILFNSLLHMHKTML